MFHKHLFPRKDCAAYFFQEMVRSRILTQNNIQASYGSSIFLLPDVVKLLSGQVVTFIL